MVVVPVAVMLLLLILVTWIVISLQSPENYSHINPGFPSARRTLTLNQYSQRQYVAINQTSPLRPRMFRWKIKHWSLSFYLWIWMVSPTQKQLETINHLVNKNKHKLLVQHIVSVTEILIWKLNCCKIPRQSCNATTLDNLHWTCIIPFHLRQTDTNGSQLRIKLFWSRIKE